MNSARREAHAPQLDDMLGLAAAFYQFVTQHGNDTPANKQRPCVAVPVHAGSSALVIGSELRMRVQFSCLLEMTINIVQKENRRGSLEQVTITGPGRDIDWQANRSRVFAIRPIKEALAALPGEGLPQPYCFDRRLNLKSTSGKMERPDLSDNPS